jgi:AraC-like DNA-binding protein
MVVTQIFHQTGLSPLQVEMGEVHLDCAFTPSEQSKIQNSLNEAGFEILDSRRQKLIENIKKLIIKKVQDEEIETHFRLSDFIRKELNQEYTNLSRLFSENEATTIEQYFILQKIEKVKELLVYGQLTLSEITWKLGYSSVAHLSSQFKRITGFTPSQFKGIGISHRYSIDKVQKTNKYKLLS